MLEQRPLCLAQWTECDQNRMGGGSMSVGLCGYLVYSQLVH
jgi:hypothetical protein